MSQAAVLTGDLLLNKLSARCFPEVAHYRNIKTIDLQQLKNIDSAGLAYIAQIKSRYPDISITGVSDKISVLAGLYGLDFLFNA